MRHRAIVSFLSLVASANTIAVTLSVNDAAIEQQRSSLAENTQEKGFGPQSPRDIDNLQGHNKRTFAVAPKYTHMNLCNIHFHKNAEHKGGEFTKYAGNGDGKGYNTGYRYTGKLSNEELKPFEYQHLKSGDTIEVHYVYSSADVNPGPTLKACLSKSINNPDLRVESQVMVLVNDENATHFDELTHYEKRNGYYQATNIPTNTGKPIEYLGSTTGPNYNEVGSPFQVTWSVRPKVAKVSIQSVVEWLKNNDFDEHHAHGVRNLIVNPNLLSAN